MMVTPTVVKKNPSFSILLLRNDSNVVRFRFNSFWAKFFVVFFLFFSGAGGSAGYFAYYYWNKYNALHQEHSELEEKLRANNRNLDVIAGIEKLKETSAFPRTTMTGVATVGAKPAQANSDAAGKGDGVSAAEEGSDRSAGQTSRPSVTGAPGGAGAAAPENADDDTAGSAAGGSSTGTQTPSDDAVPGDKISAHPALIEKVVIRPAGSRSYRLSYEMRNQERDQERPPLSGGVQIAVSAKNGARSDISTISGDSLRFFIKYGKTVAVTFSLPSDLNPKDMDKLLLTVDTDGLPPVTYSFPMPQTP
ncbi:hypothetical protein FACS1894206_01060 [Deltaproteobacteria bacterium]|nr:hypothetical protein FACS1894206_01060 [Deltaproteobacteria bacterium]